MINHVFKTIYFRFSNKFTKQPVLTMQLPYLPFQATNGYYSTMFKRMKDASAFLCDKKLMKGKFWFESTKSKRAVISFSNGVSLNMPYDVSEKDIDIIKHYIVGVRMSLEK